jgi:hypothetical protein
MKYGFVATSIAFCSLVLVACSDDFTAPATADAGSSSQQDAGSSTTQDGGTPSPDAGEEEEIVDSGPPPVAETDAGITPDAGPLVCANEGREPNDSEATAAVLTGIDDCDSNAGSLNSVGSGWNDYDFFKFAGTDKFGCTADPTAKINVTGADLCVYTVCKTGPTTYGVCTGGIKTTLANGRTACCTAGMSNVTQAYSCDGSDDSADVYMRVRSRQNICLAYQLQYHF